ncbi:DUF6228 family protein [Embleya scabrispora]|uniref:DUF6228 family protein n=1 Tax=Embleya scabrispora TaxID=159449 RepID=UPI00036BF344|nr:DUF6228 family protein [Embleya scabrispora]
MHPHFDAANESYEPTGSTDPDDVIIRCNDNPAIRIRLRDAVSPDDEVAARYPASRLVHYTVEIQAPGMAAHLDRVVGWTGEAREIAGFLTDLARDFGGWDGERRWHTDDRDLTVTAVFRSGGRVELTWELRPRRMGGCGWAASVTLVVEAGEQLAMLAADVRQFLSRAGG